MSAPSSVPPTAAPMHDSSPPPSSSNKFISRSIVPTSVWVIGSAMCLINISFVVIYSLTALFLNTSLGISTIWIGLLEGAVEALSYITKLFSGMMSDYLRRRKAIMIIGYTLTVISKPILALSGSYAVVFAARMFERLGNGIQATPRDAMVSDIAPSNRRGSCFGLMRSLGTAGSFLGGILGFGAMWYTGNNFQQVFWIASFPALLSIIILILFVKEPQKNTNTVESAIKEQRRPLKCKDINLLPRDYWCTMGIVAVFMLARISETLMVLHAHNTFGLDMAFAPLIMSLYNSTYCLSSYPSGWLSDKIGRNGVLAFGVCALIISDLFIAASSSLTGVFIGVVIWGIQMGVTNNTFLSMVADHVPEDLRGTGFGMYYLISALSSALAGLGGGTMAKYFGYPSAFFASMFVAIISLIALRFFRPGSQKMVAVSAN